MKKALVIACILGLGIGLMASGQGVCSGEFSFSFDMNIISLNDPCTNPWIAGMPLTPMAGLFGASSTLALNYGVGTWLFGGEAQFDAALGYASQTFDVIGALGAFTLSAKMTFLPQAITLSEQRFKMDFQPEEIFWLIYNNDGDDCDTCPDACCNCPKEEDDSCKLTVLVAQPWMLWKVNRLSYCSMLDAPIVTVEPRFQDIEASLSVAIAGIEIEGLAVLNAWEGTATEEQVFEWTVCNEGLIDVWVDPNAYFANVVQSGPSWPVNFPWMEHGETMDLIWAWATPVEQTCSCTAGGDDAIGTGFRLKLAGVAGPLSVTSYTYFSMTESDLADDTITLCPVLGKKGDYEVAGECGVAFTEEYLMVEGIPLSCDMVLDAALKLVCPDVSTTYECVCENDTLEKVQSGSTAVINFPWDGTPPDCEATETRVDFEYLKLLVHPIPIIPTFFDVAVAVTLTEDEKEFQICGIPAWTYPTCFSINWIANWEEDESHNGIANKLTGIDIKDLAFTTECNGVTFTDKTVLYDLPTNALKTINSLEVLKFLVPLDCDTRTDLYGGSFDACPPFKDNGAPGLDPGDKILVEYWETPKYKYHAWESLSIAVDGDACCGAGFAFDVDIYIGKKYEANPEFCGAICKTDTTKDCCCEPAEQNYKCCWDIDPNYEEVGVLGSLFSWMATDVSASFGVFSNFNFVIDASISFRGWETLKMGVEFLW